MEFYMKIVVTGSTGHIGNVLIRELIKKGYTDVSAFIRTGEKVNIFEGLKIPFVYGDVRDIESLKKAFSGADIVFHLAGLIDIGNGNKKLMHEVNVEGSKNVIEACKKCKVKKLIYTSSVHAIPPKPMGEVISETKNFSPDLVKGTYAKTKAEATKYMLEANSEDLEVIITHPSGVIGPYEYITSNLGQLIIDCAKRRMKAYIDGGYNFVDVRDVALGLISALEKGRAGECYILAGHYVSIKDLLKYVEDITNVPAPKVKLARWFAYGTGVFAEIYYKIVKQKPLFTSYSVYTTGTNSNFSIEKAKKELGYAPRDFKETMVDTISWMKENGKI